LVPFNPLTQSQEIQERERYALIDKVQSAKDEVAGQLAATQRETDRLKVLLAAEAKKCQGLTENLKQARRELSEYKTRAASVLQVSGLPAILLSCLITCSVGKNRRRTLSNNL
jgi:chromosome segregation ATPase